MTESIIRSDARFRYYNQISSYRLEKIHDDSSLKTKEKNSIKDVMKKRGMKWDYNSEIFYMYSETRFDRDLDTELQRKDRPEKSYEEIEAIVRAERQ